RKRKYLQPASQTKRQTESDLNTEPLRPARVAATPPAAIARREFPKHTPPSKIYAHGARSHRPARKIQTEPAKSPAPGLERPRPSNPSKSTQRRPVSTQPPSLFFSRSSLSSPSRPLHTAPVGARYIVPVSATNECT